MSWRYFNSFLVFSKVWLGNGQWILKPRRIQLHIRPPAILRGGDLTLWPKRNERRRKRKKRRRLILWFVHIGGIKMNRRMIVNGLQKIIGNTEHTKNNLRFVMNERFPLPFFSPLSPHLGPLPRFHPIGYTHPQFGCPVEDNLLLLRKPRYQRLRSPGFLWRVRVVALKEWLLRRHLFRWR